MTTIAQAFVDVSPFVSQDAARSRLAKPAAHASHVVATDGHTMAVVRYDGEGRTDDDVAFSRDAAPPWIAVLPATLTHIGELVLPERLAHYPAKWAVCVTFRPGGTATVSAQIPARTGRHGKVLRAAITMIHADRIDGFEAVRPREAIGVNGAYLERAVEFIGRGIFRTCQVYAADPMDPIVFVDGVASCRTREDLLALDRFAIVMPMCL